MPSQACLELNGSERLYSCAGFYVLPFTLLGVSHGKKAVVVRVVISCWKLHNHVSYITLTR